MEENKTIALAVKTFNKCFTIDRAKTQPIIDKALKLKGDRYISTVGMDKETWLSIRVLLGIGGSEAATAIGANKYQSAYELWKQKVSDEVEMLEGDYLDWGTGLEDFLRQQYKKLTGNKEVYADDMIRIHPTIDCLYINLDGIVAKGKKEIGTIEIKTTVRSVYKSWADNPEENPQGIPLYHYAQVQHGLSITGLKWCDLIYGIVDTRRIEIKRIKRDDEYILKHETFLAGWWNAYVVQNEAPPMTVAEFQYIDPIPGSSIEANPDMLDLHKTILEKNRVLLELTKQIKGWKDEMKEFIGESEGLTSVGELIAIYKTVIKKEFTVKEKTYRQLTVKKPKTI